MSDEYDKAFKDLMQYGSAYMDNGKHIPIEEVQLKYTEAELQEKLRQQREACALAWINHGSLYDCADVIRSAEIGNDLCDAHRRFPCKECGTKHFNGCQCVFCK